MELFGFSVGDDFISLVYEHGRLDLHNDYAFAELRHHPAECSAVLSWSRRTSEWTSAKLPSAFAMHFSGVHLLKVSERDSELPTSEDNCLSMLGFLWNHLLHEMNGCAKVAPEPDCSHLVAVFQGGAAVKIGAQAVRLELPAGA